jgi:hypothetical protein
MLLYKKFNKKIWLFLILNLCIGVAFSQDTIPNKIHFDIKADLWGSQIFESSNAAVSMPENIRSRRSSSINAPSDFYSITDNPLKHGAYYACIKTITSFTSAFKVNIDIYGEHRGVSYGVINTNNTIVFPVISAVGSDSFYFFKKKIIGEGKVGHFLDEQLDEGLLIYNTDVQGIQAGLGTDIWKMVYTLYGDLYNGIGLNIDDLHAVTIERYFGSDNKSLIGISLYAIAPPRTKKADHLVWSLMAKKNTNNGSFYFQAGYRSQNQQDINFEKGFIEQIGLVVGHKLSIESKYFDFNNQTEFRFYGKSFNKNNYVEGIKYRRDLTQQPLYANTIGEYLYPLHKFDTPFGQWAVFTEYQGLDIAGLNFFGNLRYKSSPKTEIDLGYDFNAIFCGRDTSYSLKSSNNFLYPFFTLAFFYKPVPKVKAGIIFTNKGMNLDMSYPTLYLYKRPYFGIKLSTSF